MATPAAMRGPVKGPELGSFPLDHFRECKKEVEAYYRCLEKHDRIAPMCRDLVRDYLKCRMDRGLMTRADVDSFGLPHTDFVPTTMHKQDIRRDAARVGGATWVHSKYEKEFKSKELQNDDGFEAIKGTTTPAPENMIAPLRTGDRQYSNRTFEVPNDRDLYGSVAATAAEIKKQT